VQVTTKDIAKACGVSLGTVDRALHGKPRIDPATKALVLRTAKELGYRPDLLARGLVKGRTMSIGVVAFDVKNRYFAQLVSSIEMAAKRRGYFINITLHEDDPAMERRLIESLVDRRADGLILCPVGRGPEFARYLEGLGLPLVVIGNLVSAKLPFVGLDEKRAAKDAVEHILARGYERVAFVCPPLSEREGGVMYSHEQRLAGFEEAMAPRGRGKGPESIILGDWNYEGVLASVVESSPRRTAFFCSGDIFALNCLKRLGEKGIGVPSEAGIMGFDNIDTLDYVAPRLATVDNPVAAIGEKAVESLLALIDGEEVPPAAMLPHRIIEGGSL
jgi:LacI family transcriptional regulator